MSLLLFFFSFATLIVALKQFSENSRLSLTNSEMRYRYETGLYGANNSKTTIILYSNKSTYTFLHIMRKLSQLEKRNELPATLPWPLDAVTGHELVVFDSFRGDAVVIQ